ncbi:amidohydrolase family protein [Pseudomonas sp. PDM17]|uniref:metal-dependent hydrolase family protein n=1 Tax=Pseudomonas sp. PDM17 TaxID=2769285 RepID=UPI00177A94A9|nr:amidohydrolase family protein [Pseudomonas sp. PDM17]MBD9502260.1 amidohydrolase family protein [Pseudomonas sp. PDM17]
MNILLKNAQIFDGKHPSLHKGDVLVSGPKILSLHETHQPAPQDTLTIDLNGKYLMPGLIDAHVHITASQVDLNQETELPGYVYARSFSFLDSMLARGFTSVRDAGGADAGIKRAIEDQVIRGPRLFMSGRALSQTGGHGDFRHPSSPMLTCACSLHTGSTISVIADGLSAVRKAVREQFRMGASQIKVMAGGGIASPNDRIENLQYSEAELSVIVDEAERYNSYVMAHAYSPAAIIRCVRCGVRSIEHGNLLNAEAAQVMHEHDAFLVPTLSIYNAFILNAGNPAAGIPDSVLIKLKDVQSQALEAVRIARRHGVKIGLGTDLLGEFHSCQTDEFKLRAQVDTPFDVLQSATRVNAELLNMQDQLGVVAPGALADLIVLDQDPLQDLSLFDAAGTHVQMVIKNGEILKNQLH